MDYNKKPELKNPRKGANALSQLFFAWIIPMTIKGYFQGIHNKDLTKCLNVDSSQVLGEKLEM